LALRWQGFYKATFLSAVSQVLNLRTVKNAAALKNQLAEYAEN
jgi:hypothetical protein